MYIPAEPATSWLFRLMLLSMLPLLAKQRVLHPRVMAVSDVIDVVHPTLRFGHRAATSLVNVDIVRPQLASFHVSSRWRSESHVCPSLYRFITVYCAV